MGAINGAHGVSAFFALFRGRDVGVPARGRRTFMEHCVLRYPVVQGTINRYCPKIGGERGAFDQRIQSNKGLGN